MIKWAITKLDEARRIAVEHLASASDAQINSESSTPTPQDTYRPSLAPSRRRQAPRISAQRDLYPLALASTLALKLSDVRKHERALELQSKLLLEEKQKYAAEKIDLEQQKHTLEVQKDQLRAENFILEQQKRTLESEKAQLEGLEKSLPFLQEAVENAPRVQLRTSDNKLLIYSSTQYQGTGTFFDAAARWEGRRDQEILVPFSKARVEPLMEQLICQTQEAFDIDEAARNYFSVGSAHTDPAKVVDDIMQATFSAFADANNYNSGKRVKISAQWVRNLEDFLRGLRHLDPEISAYPQDGDNFRLITPEIYQALGKHVKLPSARA